MRGVLSVSKNFDTLLKNASIFSRGMQAAARTRFRSHTCGLRSVFSDVHAAGKHDSTSSAVYGRRNSARLLQHKSQKYTLSTV